MRAHVHRASVDGKYSRMRLHGRFYMWFVGRPTYRSLRSRLDQELNKTVFRRAGRRLKLTRRERLIDCGISILVLLAGLVGGGLACSFTIDNHLIRNFDS